MEADQKRYWLNDDELAWVRDNYPDAKISCHPRMVIEGSREILNGEAVSFPRGGLTRARRAGHKPKEAEVQKNCDLCRKPYVPGYDNDPCIEALPGIKYACCGHGSGNGYLFFENGIVVRFKAGEIERNSETDCSGCGPQDAPFWKAA